MDRCVAGFKEKSVLFRRLRVAVPLNDMRADNEISFAVIDLYLGAERDAEFFAEFGADTFRLGRVVFC